jgi:hypothetical protein
MPVTLQLKNSTTKGKAPDPSGLEYGELCVNAHSESPAIYFKDNAGGIIKIGPGANVPEGNSPPGTGNQIGDLYWDSSSGFLLAWNGSAWVVAGVEHLDDLKDVDTSGVVDGMVLAYDNGIWSAVSAASIAIDVDLDYTAAPDKGTVTNSAGDDAVIPLATGTNAGLSLNNYTTAEKDKLGGIEDGAEANVVTSVHSRTGDVVAAEGDYSLDQMSDVDTSGASDGKLLKYQGGKWVAGSAAAVSVDLGYTPAADKGTVTNDAGTDAEIPLATGTNAGLTLNNFTTAEKDKLDGLPNPGAITDGTVTSVDSGHGLTGGPITDAGTLAVLADGDTITVSAAGIKVTDGKFAEPGDIPDVSVYLPFAGGNMTGGVTATVRTITAGAFDLATGNLWECGGISVPNPTNAVAGMTGVIVFSDAPTAFGSNFKFPDGTPIAPSSFPAVAPFYVKGSSEILVGKAVEGIA